MQSSITKVRNFDESTLTYGDIATNKYGGKFLYVNHRTGRIFMQFPKMNIPFGVNEYIPKDEKTGQPTGEDPKYSCILSFYKMGENPKLKQAHDKLVKIDEAIIDAAIVNHETWFPGQFTKYKNSPDKLRVAIETLYSPLVKVDTKHGKYPPNIRVKLPRYDGIFKMEIYDKSNKKTPVKFGDNVDEGEVPITKYLNKGTTMTPVVSMPMINFTKGFGASFTLVQGVAKPASTFMGSCVIDDSDEEDEDENTSPAQQGNMIDDSDEEDEDTNGQDTNGQGDDNVVIDSDDDEDEPEPEPEPVKPKKGRRRKKKSN